MNEYFHDMMVRAKFYNPVYKTALFESVAKGNISSFRFYKNFDEELKIILKEAANILKNNQELFHDQLFNIFDENKKYKRILATPGFKTILYRELQDLCQYTGLGKVRGLKKNNVRCYDKYGSTSR